MWKASVHPIDIKDYTESKQKINFFTLISNNKNILVPGLFFTLRIRVFVIPLQTLQSLVKSLQNSFLNFAKLL